VALGDNATVGEDFGLLGDDFNDLFEFTNLAHMVFGEPAYAPGANNSFHPSVLAATAVVPPSPALATAAPSATVAPPAAFLPSQQQLLLAARPAAVSMPGILMPNSLMSYSSMMLPSVTVHAPSAMPALPYAAKLEFPTGGFAAGLAAGSSPGVSSGNTSSSSTSVVRRSVAKCDQAAMRRERNRVLAKRTRLRKKFFFQSLQQQVLALHKENLRLRDIVQTRCGKRGQQVLSECEPETPILVTQCAKQATALLRRSDFLLMKVSSSIVQALQCSYSVINRFVYVVQRNRQVAAAVSVLTLSAAYCIRSLTVSSVTLTYCDKLSMFNLYVCMFLLNRHYRTVSLLSVYVILYYQTAL
jgi:Basic region leucine zipper